MKEKHPAQIFFFPNLIRNKCYRRLGSYFTVATATMKYFSDNDQSNNFIIGF